MGPLMEQLKVLPVACLGKITSLQVSFSSICRIKESLLKDSLSTPCFLTLTALPLLFVLTPARIDFATLYLLKPIVVRRLRFPRHSSPDLHRLYILYLSYLSLLYSAISFFAMCRGTNPSLAKLLLLNSSMYISFSVFL